VDGIYDLVFQYKHYYLMSVYDCYCCVFNINVCIDDVIYSGCDRIVLCFHTR
jgi:hypothetical protein